MKVLVVIDMQNDFISGSLGSKEAQAVVPAVEKRVAEATDDLVIFTRDTHTKAYLQTQEGAYLPVEHCIEGTAGWNIAEPLKPYSEKAVIIDKPTFGSLDLPKIIRKLTGNNLQEIELCGVCTDICVVSNALILKAAFPETKVTVQSELCAGATPQGHRAALEIMQTCQVDVQI
jgi:nicotinamidase-related amidase